jgi:hypothetical protein
MICVEGVYFDESEQDEKMRLSYNFNSHSCTMSICKFMTPTFHPTPTRLYAVDLSYGTAFLRVSQPRQPPSLPSFPASHILVVPT